MVTVEEIKEKIIILKFGSIKEYKETLLMLRLLHKKARSQTERRFIRRQAHDLVKIGGVIIIAALPGGSFLMAFIETGLRRWDKTMLPSAFSMGPDHARSDSNKTSAREDHLSGETVT